MGDDCVGKILKEMRIPDNVYIYRISYLKLKDPTGMVEFQVQAGLSILLSLKSIHSRSCL